MNGVLMMTGSAELGLGDRGTLFFDTGGVNREVMLPRAGGPLVLVNCSGEGDLHVVTAWGCSPSFVVRPQHAVHLICIGGWWRGGVEGGRDLATQR